MKTIHIRFIERSQRERLSYMMQRKNVFGTWKDIGYWQGGNYGSVWYHYMEDTKEKLLTVVLEHYYKTPKSQVIITEHPMLKIY